VNPTRNQALQTFIAVYRCDGLEAAVDAVRRKPPARACAPFIRWTCEHYNLTPQQLLRGGRVPFLADARHVAMYVARVATCASYPIIGQAMGGMDHSSIIHGVARVEKTPRLLAQAMAILDRVQRGQEERAA
jgi:chromosomal replication initiation ATPase DnaA